MFMTYYLIKHIFRLDHDDDGFGLGYDLELIMAPWYDISVAFSKIKPVIKQSFFPFVSAKEKKESPLAG